jgi:hypothetical protein
MDEEIDNIDDDHLAPMIPMKVIVKQEDGLPVTVPGDKGPMYLTTIASESEMPEIEHKVFEMTGVQGIKVVRMQIPLTSFIPIQSISDIESGEARAQMFVDDISLYTEILYRLSNNISSGYLSKDGLDYMFASKSDAENWSKIINGHYSQPFFSVDAIAVSPTANIFDSEGNQIAPNDIFVADLGESFIFVPDSKAKIYDDVYDMTSLKNAMNALYNIANIYDYDRYIEEMYDESTGYEDVFNRAYEELDGDDNNRLSMLNALHRIASVLEDENEFEDADYLNSLFVKLSKSKSKKKKNVPNNPSLWAECKAWAKRTFDVYPCVPLDSMALTKKGWAEYSDLNIGDEILTYSQSKDKLEWKPVINLHFHEDAPTLSLKKLQTNFKVRCTPDHKWVLKTPNQKYPDNLVEAKNITKRMNLKTSAEIVDGVNENLDLSNWRKGDDWIEYVLKMSKSQLEAFFAAGIVYDGHDKGLSSLNRSTYGFSQKNINHGEAMEIAAVLLGYRVSFVQKMHNPEMKSWTFIKRDSESTGNLIIEEDLNCDVWCPQTENNTWVMKQGKIITITGNSAYANGAASKRYKSKGGTWRKE